MCFPIVTNYLWRPKVLIRDNPNTALCVNWKCISINDKLLIIYKYKGLETIVKSFHPLLRFKVGGQSPLGEFMMAKVQQASIKHSHVTLFPSAGQMKYYTRRYLWREKRKGSCCRLWRLLFSQIRHVFSDQKGLPSFTPLVILSRWRNSDNSVYVSFPSIS